MSNKYLRAFLLPIAVLMFQSCDYPIRGYISSVRVIPDDDYSAVVKDPVYSEPIYIEGIDIFTQDESCGYAVLQMLGQWSGKDITEKMLYESNNYTVTTAVGNGFVKEINRRFPEWDTVRYVNLSNSELLVKVHESLGRGYPVPFEWAAKDTNGNWTLHFSLITGLDLTEDIVRVANPYGYEQTLSINAFIKATRYESYENMEWYFQAGFNTGIFNQNTIYVISKK